MHLVDRTDHRLAAPRHEQHAVHPARQLCVERIALLSGVVGAEHGEFDLDAVGLLDALLLHLLAELDTVEIDVVGFPTDDGDPVAVLRERGGKRRTQRKRQEAASH